MSLSDNKTQTDRADGYSKIILKENSESFAKWDVPDVDEGENIEEENELFPMLTAEQLEETHQQAYDEGFEQGLKKGFDEGSHNGFEEGKVLGHKQAYDIAKKEIQQKAAQINSLLASIENPFLHTVKEVEGEVQQLAFVIAKHIIRQEIAASPEYISSLVAQSLSLLPSSNKIIKIYCHPQDLELIEEYFSSLDDADKIEHKLIKDPSMQAGGIKIDSNTSFIDESLETRFKTLEETFEQMRLNEHHDKDDSEQANDAITEENYEEVTEDEPQLNIENTSENLLDEGAVIGDEMQVEENIEVATKESSPTPVEDSQATIINDATENEPESLQKTEN